MVILLSPSYPDDAFINGTAKFPLSCRSWRRQDISTIESGRTSSSRLGRPSREEQAHRLEALLEAALDIFLDRGFDQATVEEVAGSVGMSKRTVYARFADKAELFHAVVRRAIDRYTITRETLDALATDDLAETLAAVARLRIANITTPNGIKLQRILYAQSYRFPELFGEVFEIGTGPTIAFLRDLLASFEASGEIVLRDPHLTPAAFLSLAVGAPARIVITGHTISEAEIERRITFAVDLFLNGLRR